MNVVYLKSVFVYGQVRCVLQLGCYVLGQWIDLVKFVDEFKISFMLVWFVLYCLVGEGLVVDYVCNGLYVLLFIEVVLCDLYDWMEGLLLWVCEFVLVQLVLCVVLLFVVGDNDLVNFMWELFDVIVGDVDYWLLYYVVKCVNDQFILVWCVNLGLILYVKEEFCEFVRLWQSCDIVVLCVVLSVYYVCCKQVVLCIVVMLGECSEYLYQLLFMLFVLL